MDLDLFILLVATLTVVFLGLVVYLRTGRSRVGQSFLGIVLTVIVWSVSNYFADHSSNLQSSDLFTRLTFAAGIWIALAMLLFSYIFPKDRLTKKRLLVLSSLFAILTPFSLSTLVTESISKQSNVGVELTVGDFYSLYLVGFVGLILLTLWNFLKSHKAANVLRRNQLKFIALGIGVGTLFAVMTNLLIPILLNDWTSSRFGPLANIVFVGALAYAIVRYRLLNIRLIVARSIAYILLLTTLILSYAAIIFASSGFFFPNETVSAGQQAINLLAAILIAFTFQPLKRFFDRVTRRIFYRDAYETQEVLDEVSKVLVSSGLVRKITGDTLKEMLGAIKPRFIQAVIENKVDVEPILVGKKAHVPLELTKLVEKGSTQSILALDEIENHKVEPYKSLAANNIALVARLQTSKELIGFLYFAAKENGSIYTAQDINLIRIVADELSIAVQNALRFEEIARFNETLQQEVQEATKQLRESNSKLRALDEAKDEFISMASHQLRTPLTSVKGYVSMVLEGDAGKLTGDQRKLLQEAYASSQRMVYMIADFLNVSRIKTGKFLLEPGQVNLATMVQEEINQLAHAAHSRGLTVETHIPDDFPLLKLDENKIRQVIMNFIDNAIFYSKSGGTIVITLEKTDRTVTLTVKDQGIGVPKAEQPQIFSKFFRASNARHARPDGTGIGLFMAKKVITTHGGTLIFDSQENKGSTFGFTLPI